MTLSAREIRNLADEIVKTSVERYEECKAIEAVYALPRRLLPT